jgi:glycosyltransferase involved in cell wall biosynthesis/SAM-dependent methyltransferase
MGSLVNLPPVGVVEIAHRWTNIIGDPLDHRPAILIALPFLTIGGAEQLFQTVAEGLVARGYRVVVTTSLTLPDTIKEAPDRYDAITPQVYHLPRLLDTASHEEFILHLLRHHRVCGILLAGSELFYRALPRIRASFPAITILDQQFNDTGHIENNRRYRAMIDKTIVPSRALADLLIQRHGEAPDRVAVIPHGIDTRTAFWDIGDAFRASGLPPESRGKLLVSFFGRMSKEKSPEVFIEAATRLAHRSDLYFVMTGEGPEWQKIQKLANRGGLHDKLYMPGFVQDVRPLMELSGMVVLTSSVDGMPLVVLEAQALGKPVVASAVGSLPEMVIDGETGYLCPPGNVQAFCDAIEKLAGSEALRRDFGERARKFVLERYSSAAMVDAYVAALGLDNPLTSSPIRFDSVCNICGSTVFHPFAMRSDGVPVIACNHCGHCVVKWFPYDVESLYQNGYFEAGPGSARGYSDSGYTTEHGVAWAASLIELLCPAGRVLDVGCAAGQLLTKLPARYERFGVEFSPGAAAKASAAGIQMIGSDILDPQLKQNWAESFDVVSAIAVFEHLADFRGAIEAALALLKPGGALLFEVPLVTPDGQPDTWFRTSLEHIHYPTEQSIEYLFENVLGWKLAGKRIDVRNFAYTYIGVTSKDGEVMGRLAPEFDRWVNAPAATLAPREARFRWLLDLIHAANPSPEVLSLYRYADPGDYNPMLIRRLFEVWMVAQHRAASIEGELENGRALRRSESAGIDCGGT